MQETEKRELTVESLSLMIKYLEVLQRGRAIPDRHGGGTVQESKDNTDDIQFIKKKINSIIESL